ncbi:M91 family zinc metallopeptidase [Spongiimicrobium sp. 3-5]|uniref:M91 family zinc metallopeptidase n=1 Tax=Spongiimicrobium sp. 3-5 TaxID=3332596 RepID=UPI00398156CD
MKRIYLLIVLMLCVSIGYAQNPFEKFGYIPKIGTLSKGKYIEHFDSDSIVQIGSVLFNPFKNTIVGFIKTEKKYSEATLEPEIVSRWMNPDPLADEFPDTSPYVFTNNNPIRFIDPLGLAPEDIILKGTEKERQTILANLQALTNDRLSLNSNGEVTIDFENSINCDCELSEGTQVIRDLIQSNKITNIETTTGPNETQANSGYVLINDDGTPGKGSGSTVSFNPNKPEGGIDENGSTKRPTEIGLAHELLHAKDHINGTVNPNLTNPQVIDPDNLTKGRTIVLPIFELNIRRQENLIRKEQNLPARQLVGKKQNGS